MILSKIFYTQKALICTTNITKYLTFATPITNQFLSLKTVKAIYVLCALKPTKCLQHAKSFISN